MSDNVCITNHYMILTFLEFVQYGGVIPMRSTHWWSILYAGQCIVLNVNFPAGVDF